MKGFFKGSLVVLQKGLIIFDIRSKVSSYKLMESFRKIIQEFIILPENHEQFVFKVVDLKDKKI